MKKIIITFFITIALIFLLIIDNKELILNNSICNNTVDLVENITITEEVEEKIIDDWRLILVNSENALSEDFEIELSNIDTTRKFDSRAISFLLEMLKDMKNAGIYNVWPQSTYRSYEYQKGLFEEKKNTYIKLGKTEKEAETLTLQLINKPGTSEHNLGLAVDFNRIDYSFEKTKGFKWLEENAENYGFILRYKKEKKDITKINYEPWHWRFVGIEHAKKMNELDMCLEEYIEFLKTSN